MPAGHHTAAIAVSIEPTMSQPTPPVPQQPDADDIRAVLMPVSLLLLAIGLFDGGLILYSAWAGWAYTSNAYVFALAGGIFLAKGSLFTIRLALVASGFFIAATLGTAASHLLTMPGPLLKVWLTHAPADAALSTLRTIALTLVLAWIMKRLIHPVVIQALLNDGMPLANYWKRPVAGFMLGFLVPLASSVSFAAMQGSELGRMAVVEAQKLARPGESLFLESVQPAPNSDAHNRVEAQVVAYTPDGLRQLNIAWNAPMAFRSDAAAMPAAASPAP
jgi:hypothetical protein